MSAQFHSHPFTIQLQNNSLETKKATPGDAVTEKQDHPSAQIAMLKQSTKLQVLNITSG